MASDNIQPFITDPEYRAWVNELSQRYHQSQIRAAIGINSEQLRFYWSLGRDIINMHVEERWGQGVLKQLSADLTHTHLWQHPHLPTPICPQVGAK